MDRVHPGSLSADTIVKTIVNEDTTLRGSTGAVTKKLEDGYAGFDHADLSRHDRRLESLAQFWMNLQALRPGFSGPVGDGVQADAAPFQLV